MRATEMRISVPTLVNNAKALRARVPEDIKMLCVVKADAYGHGAVKLAKALSGIADAYAVAIVEEAEELRDNGVEGMIVILGGGNESSLQAAVHCGASQAVYTTEMLRVLEAEAVAVGKQAKAHIKLDTGMSRIGVRTDDELAAMLDYWKQCPHVDMEGCFTHFCVADTDPVFTKKQNDRFNEMIEKIHAAGFAPICHGAASTAMLKPECRHDMVRAGIGLYGSCMPEMGTDIQNAQTLVTAPVRIETIEAGETVGYGRTFTASRRTKVATLPIGYGDGYPRILSNRASVLVKGKRAPIIGRVCMDMIMADVTDIPEVTVDDEVVLMGRQGDEVITPDELAELAETIPYEIMLGFGPRVRRVWED
ncbi:MAG: alanine racemase [Clostridia bacterium]|nr:alanine racemase [Clostridia bacterium]